MAVANDVYTAVERLVDDLDGTAITGLLNTSLYWTTKTAFQQDDAGTTATVTITETDEADGFYGIAFTPTTPASGDPVTWVYRVVYDDGLTYAEFVGSVQVTASAPTYTQLGNVDDVIQMLRATADTDLGDDVSDRLTAIQQLVSEQLTYRLGRTFGTPATDTTIVVLAGAWATLWLPRPARSITSVTGWGELDGTTFSDGTTVAEDEYVAETAYDTGLIHALRLKAGSWGSDDCIGNGITPVQIVGDFSDSDDDAYVPADVNYAANFLIMATFRREQGIPFAAVTANGMEIPLDPWKDPVVQLVLERYSVSGRDTRLLVW